MPENTSLSQQGLPPSLNHIIGQKLVVEQAKIALDSAFQDGTAFPSALLCGAPGLGKSLLCRVISQEFQTQYIEALGQSLSLPSELNALLLSAGDKAILFIDEADEMPEFLQTVLYKATEEKRIYLESSQPGRPPQVIPISDFTLLLASNHEHSIVQPLRDRLRMVLRFEFYSSTELLEIVRQRCRRLNWGIEDAVLPLISQRGRGTPRIALRLLEGCRRVCRSLGETVIMKAHFDKACQLEGIDPIGLDRNEVQLLRMLQEAGGPVRLNVLASRLGLPSKTVSEVFEQYLIRQGLLERTADGRQITAKGREHLLTQATVGV